MVDSVELGVEPAALEGFPGAALLRLSGKGGPSAARRLQSAIQPLLAQGKKDFLLDCAAVEFFNSTSLGYFINLADTLQSAGGGLSFCRMPAKVRKTFDLLSLGELFRFFADENDWVLDARKRPPKMPAAAPEPEPKEPLGTPPAETSHKLSALATLPAWLEEADQAAPPPLDHLRWSALLQSAARRMATNPVAPVAERLGIPATGPLIQVIRRLLKRCQSPQELLGLFEEPVLSEMCRLYGLGVAGPKESLVDALISFVQTSTSESLSMGAAEPPPQDSPLSAMTAPELTHDQVHRALESCPLPKLLRSESAARDLLQKQLSKAFGADQVSRGRELGRHVKAKVDLDLSERFGVLVRMAETQFGKAGDSKKMFALLGQVVLLAGIYGRGNLFVALVGEVKRDQALALGELRSWIDGAGGRVLHLRPAHR